ncbi:Vitamin K-dependent gamma-carboxylase [Catalinimonas alkaloidigena]|uniref:Vitamin K-dependent gamma-carboxylase n=2 Tax=Catalinimonas alkaloidigena TaxID=1075417 RepID=A0A1G9JIY9_9BACT|nr:Vitamin K-dependent gamma-carboxylase [Catalinimonas alkaloidigena]
MMLVSTVRFVWNGWVETQYLQPRFFFPFYGFAWVKPLPATGMYLVFGGMALAAVGMLLGWRYRLSSVAFFLLFTYTELIDKTNYLNHYYFVSLVSFLMIWLPAHRAFSLDVVRNPQLRRTHVPRWTVALLQLQLGLVYCYAGIAKLNRDWLFEALPLKIWLPVHMDFPVIGPLFRYGWVAFAFSWFGALYDLTVPFFLLFRRTRLWAYGAVIAFHVLTWLLFPIGMFPFIMIGMTLIFFSPRFHQLLLANLRRLGVRLRLVGQRPAGYLPRLYRPRATGALALMLGVYVVIQLLLPWRYLLYPGDLFWTEEGYRFSWRVMLMEKAGYVTFHITDPATGHVSEVYASDYLTPQQEKMMATQPDMMLQFAHFLHDEFQKRGIADPQVRAEAYVTLNGQGSRLFLDPTVDLAQERESFRHKRWILPYQATPHLSAHE